MIWAIEVSVAAEHDIELLFEHLIESYMSFGEPRVMAEERAVERIHDVLDKMNRIGTAPFRGKAYDHLLSGLRQLTLDHAIYWYVIDKNNKTVRVLAIFYGGQDHIRQMLLRLLISAED